MTERERRELGLPPTAAQIAFAENILRSVEEPAERMAAAITKTITPMVPALKEIQEKSDFYTRLSTPMIVAPIDRKVFIQASPRMKESEPVDYDVLADKVAARMQTSNDIELLYDRSTYEFSRTVLGKKSVSVFADTNNNKRKKLFERVLRANGKFVKTDELLELLESSDTQALAKVVQGINKKIKRDLRISSLIKGLQRSGYRINPSVSIRKV